jgi:hypothetical protein
MNWKRASGLLPISVDTGVGGAFVPSITLHPQQRAACSGSMVVSFSCAGSISPKALEATDLDIALALEHRPQQLVLVCIVAGIGDRAACRRAYREAERQDRDVCSR